MLSNYLPDPALLERYQQLSIVGVLFFVLIVGLAMLIVVFRRLNALMSQFVGLVKENTKALTTVSVVLAAQKEAENALHDRVDDLLLCAAHECPVRQIRVRLQQPVVATSTLTPQPQT